VNGEDEEFAHGANVTTTAIACKTARHRRIPSYCEFATDTVLDGWAAALGGPPYAFGSKSAIGDMVTYIRVAWENSGAPATPAQANGLRKLLPE
jgi:hypothetical protein